MKGQNQRRTFYFNFNYLTCGTTNTNNMKGFFSFLFFLQMNILFNEETKIEKRKKNFNCGSIYIHYDHGDSQISGFYFNFY